MVRFKNRWFLVEFIPVNVENGSSVASEELSSKSVYKSLKESVIHNFGAAGWGAVGSSLNVKYFSSTTNICIVRVARDHHRVAWGATTLIASMAGRRYIPQVLQVSGTIKKIQLAAIQHDREAVARMKSLRADASTAYLETSQKEIEALQD